MRIPANKIIPAQTTSGGEYMYSSTQQDYVGDYYQVGNQYYSGSTFSSDAAELLPQTNNNLNVLKSQASTYNFGQLNTNSSLNSLLSADQPQNTIYTITSNDVAQGYVVRYFSQQTNITPQSIIEITETTYNTLQGNSLYLTVSLNYYLLIHDTTPGNFLPNDLSMANTIIPGLMAFLSS
jgi:hypothetical protein